MLFFDNYIAAHHLIICLMRSYITEIAGDLEALAYSDALSPPGPAPWRALSREHDGQFIALGRSPTKGPIPAASTVVRKAARVHPHP